MCRTTASFQSAHSQVAAAFAETARLSGVQYSDRNVPCHVTSNKVGDAICKLTHDSAPLVLDFSIVHPQSGNVNGGTWNPSALAQAAHKKCIKHGAQYAVMGFEFAPCVATTYGQLEADLLRLLYILARKHAELVHVHHRPLCDVAALFRTFFAQSRARIGAAVARGMAQRALGCSSLGASKVFLRHIAPARYRDLNLSSGTRVVAGDAQWRLALAA